MPRFRLSRVATAALGVALFALQAPAQTGAGISQQRQAELLNLLKHDCGSCHGLTMKGGLGSALGPREVGELSVESLAAIILDGVPETAMPPWRPLLSETEADWLARQLKQGVPR